MTIISRRPGADPTLFKMLLRKLDFSREHFEKPMEEYSEGQRKKGASGRKPGGARPPVSLG